MALSTSTRGQDTGPLPGGVGRGGSIDQLQVRWLAPHISQSRQLTGTAQSDHKAAGGVGVSKGPPNFEQGARQAYFLPLPLPLPPFSGRSLAPRAFSSLLMMAWLGIAFPCSYSFTIFESIMQSWASCFWVNFFAFRASTMRLDIALSTVASAGVETYTQTNEFKM